MEGFLKLNNKIVIELKIKPLSPLNIKLGRNKECSDNVALMITSESDVSTKVDIDKSKVDYTKRKGEIYIPGSTLKGMFRDRFLDIYESNYNKEIASEKIENIFGRVGDKDSKGKKALKGRIFLEDAYFHDEEKRKNFFEEGSDALKKFLNQRSITPIDHFSGKVVAPLALEYTTECFRTEVIVNNITKEEIQAIYFLIRDSQLGEIRIGNSKTRGFGQIELEIENLRFDNYIGKNEFFERLKKYFTTNDKNSIKFGDKYLCESFDLKKEMKKVNYEESNDFIKSLFEGDD